MNTSVNKFLSNATTPLIKLCLIIWAAFLTPLSQANQVSDWATQQTLSSAKEHRLGQLAAQVPEIKKCQDQNHYAQTRDCLSESLKKLSPEKLQQLQQQLQGIKSHARQNAPDAINTEEYSMYLAQRFSQLLYPNAMTQQDIIPQITHDEFTRLYKSMVGNHVLMKVSEYCLTHFKEEKLSELSSHQIKNFNKLIESMSQNESAFEKHYKACLSQLYSLCDGIQVTNEQQSSSDLKELQGCLTYTQLQEYHGILSKLDENLTLWEMINAQNHKTFQFEDSQGIMPIDYNEIIHISSKEVADRIQSSDQASAEENTDLLSDLKMAYTIDKQIKIRQIEQAQDEELRQWGAARLGKSREEIDNYDLDQIKKLLTQRYEIQGKAIHKSIQQRLADLTSDHILLEHKEASEISANLPDTMNNKKEAVELILRYHNVASSYLCLGDQESCESDQRRNNLAPLQREIRELAQAASQEDYQWILNLDKQGNVRSPAGSGSEIITLEKDTLASWLKNPSLSD